MTQETYQPFPISVLDLAPILAGGTATEAFYNSLDLAQHAEKWGYNRYWLAEHHNMPGIASAATSVVIGYIAGGTSTIRVGSGGIMLPNHSPLVIAEQFGTLASLYPGRIDLGLGRAPGTDQATARAMRRDLMAASDRFPQDVVELQSYLGPATPSQRVKAVPGTGTNVPLWLLGSSDFSAQLSAALGLRFAFASHFAPDYLLPALELYRRNFTPSETLSQPYAMVGVTVVAADTDAEAQRLFTSLQQQFVNLRRGNPGPLQPPVEGTTLPWSAMEQHGINQALSEAIVGSPETVRRGLVALQKKTKADEIIITAQVYDHAARLRSYEIVADVAKSLMTSEYAGAC